MEKIPWIPCDERMPERCKYYLVYVSGSKRSDCYDIDFWGGAWARSRPSYETVTHWKPVTPPVTITNKEA